MKCHVTCDSSAIRDELSGMSKDGVYWEKLRCVPPEGYYIVPVLYSNIYYKWALTRKLGGCLLWASRNIIDNIGNELYN